MNTLIKSGQFLFGIAIAAFGFEMFAFHSTLVALLPLPAIAAKLPIVYILGGLFVAAGVCLLLRIKPVMTAQLLALLLGVLLVWLHLGAWFANLHNGGKWTVVFELTALIGGALFSAAVAGKGNTNRGLFTTGSLLYVVALVVFSIQHFMYADFIATLIPAWMPFRLFWAYFVGIAFMAAAISILSGILTRLSALLLALMFLLWVVMLHAPRVIGSMRIEAEWTSMFIALAMAAISLLLAGKASGAPGRRFRS